MLKEKASVFRMVLVVFAMIYYSITGITYLTFLLATTIFQISAFQSTDFNFITSEHEALIYAVGLFLSLGTISGFIMFYLSKRTGLLIILPFMLMVIGLNLYLSPFIVPERIILELFLLLFVLLIMLKKRRILAFLPESVKEKFE